MTDADKRLEEIEKIRERMRAYTAGGRIVVGVLTYHDDVLTLIDEIDALRAEAKAVQEKDLVLITSLQRGLLRLRAEAKEVREKALEEAANVCGQEVLEHGGRSTKNHHQRAMALGLVAEIRSLKQQGE